MTCCNSVWRLTFAVEKGLFAKSLATCLAADSVMIIRSKPGVQKLNGRFLAHVLVLVPRNILVSTWELKLSVCCGVNRKSNDVMGLNELCLTYFFFSHARRTLLKE